jgi:sirohydrochlorin cobaltochelatase
MIATGKHVLGDMAGDNEKSWKSVLEGMGFKVEFSVKGLGEINGIQKIFIRHVKSAMDGNEIII